MNKEGHKFVRIDGSVDGAARTKAIQALNEDSSVRFILCGLTSGGYGINLTRANVVMMMDPWWNAVTVWDRLVRFLCTFLMKDSIE